MGFIPQKINESKTGRKILLLGIKGRVKME
jgi:hypothetical protein